MHVLRPVPPQPLGGDVEAGGQRPVRRHPEGERAPLEHRRLDQPGVGHRHDGARVEVRIGGQCRDAVGEPERRPVDVGPVPGGVRAQRQVDAADLLVDVRRAQRDGQVEPADALGPGEQLVQRHPELAARVAGLLLARPPEPQRDEGRLVTGAPHRDVGRVPGGQHPDAVRIAVDPRQETPAPAVVARLGGAHPGDARAGEHQVGVPLVRGLRRRPVLGREDDDGQGRVGRAGEQVGQGRRTHPEHVVLHHGQLRRGREPAQLAPVRPHHDVRRGQRVEEQAAGRDPRLHPRIPSAAKSSNPGTSRSIPVSGRASSAPRSAASMSSPCAASRSAQPSGPTCRRPHGPRPAGPFVPRLPARGPTRCPVRAAWRSGAAAACRSCRRPWPSAAPASSWARR